MSLLRGIAIASVCLVLLPSAARAVPTRTSITQQQIYNNWQERPGFGK